ncbi:16842_t:CDS:2, partial [Dentiscutata heterogama]
PSATSGALSCNFGQMSTWLWHTELKSKTIPEECEKMKYCTLHNLHILHEVRYIL